MTPAAELAVQWWTEPPAYQVSYLAGVDPELLGIALDPVPATAPAVVRFRPATGMPLGDQVSVLLDELDRVAVALFPAWLPGAERLDGAHGLSAAAVRALAAETAGRSAHFGPFLADIAERALLRRTGHAARVPAEVRAAGLARVIADAYRREAVALLIEVPDGLSAADERALTSAAEWLSSHGHLTVWLAGAALQAADRIRTVALSLPAYLTELAGEAEGIPAAPEPSSAPVVWYAPLSGRPRADSAAEQALERALASHDWAQGRRWNYTYQWHPLAQPYRLDVFWPVEGLVVEVDGPEHRGRLLFASDRRRDVQLHALGHLVLRFTNKQVLSDVQATALMIGQLVEMRRHAGD